MRDENQLLQQKLRAMLQPKEPTVSMSQLVRIEHKATNDADGVFVEQPGVGQLHHHQTSSKFVVNNLL